MPRFSSIAKGNAARKRGVTFSTLTGAEAACDLRLLTGADDEEILAAAIAATRKAGGQPVEGDLVFDFARACEVVARAAVDSESTDEAPVAYFDSVQQVKENLDRERILLLFETQMTFQEDTSPRLGKMELDEFVQHLYEHALVPEGAELPFERWQPALRRSWVRSLVDLLLTLDAPKSLSGSLPTSSSASASGTSRPS